MIVEVNFVLKKIIRLNSRISNCALINQHVMLKFCAVEYTDARHS